MSRHPEPGGEPSGERSVEIARPVGEALALVERAAEEWGAAFEREGDGGALQLPVRAGLRLGIIEARITAEPTGQGTRLALAPTSEQWRVQGAAVVVLLLAAAGGVVTVAWPFFPALVPLAPFGALLALSGWFLIVSRLRSSRPEDFLTALELLAERPGGIAEGRGESRVSS